MAAMADLRLPADDDDDDSDGGRTRTRIAVGDYNVGTVVGGRTAMTMGILGCGGGGRGGGGCRFFVKAAKI